MTSTSSNPSLLPPPRSSLETQWTGAYRLHLNNLPDATGFFQVRNSRGEISVPAVNQIVNRDTTDYSFNFGLNPTFRLGDNIFTFNTGVQETVRRDAQDPVDMNQNLFRQFVYMSTSSFFNLVAVNGFAIREAGPFTERDLHSRDLGAQLNFRIGRPWGKTALLTGYGVRDLQFSPTIREFFFTSSFVGVERKVTDNFTVKVLAEHLRAWRVEGNQFAIAQALRPAANLEYSPPAIGAWKDRSRIPATWGSTFTTRFRAPSRFRTACRSDARLRRREGTKFCCAIRFVSRWACSSRVFSISTEGTTSSSGPLCASRYFDF